MLGEKMVLGIKKNITIWLHKGVFWFFLLLTKKRNLFQGSPNFIIGHVIDGVPVL